MKKVGKIVLAVWAVLATFLLVMACVAYNEVDAEWSAKYDDVSDKYADLLAEKNGFGLDVADEAAFAAWADCISEKNFVCKIDDETALVAVYTEGRTQDEFMADLAEYGAAFNTVIESAGLSNGVILIVDDDNNVWAGTTVAADGSSLQFARADWWFED